MQAVSPWLAVLGAAIMLLDAPAVRAQAPGSNITPAAAEVVRLSQSGTSDEVILAYVQNSPAPFNLSADNILYLKDLGLSSQVIAGMLNRDNASRTLPPRNPSPQPATPVIPPSVPELPSTPDTGPPPDYLGNPPDDVNYFYTDLSPYGTWVVLEGIGWCWQPSIVVINHGWRPYCDGGHWIYTEAGWFWQSDYSWGWAAFHYGRWSLHPSHGWVWTPDKTWGPAWVAWRAGEDHCGWAPLPPHTVFDAAVGWRFNGIRVGVNSDFGLGPDQFTFVALRDFTDHDLGHHRLPPAEVAKIYKQTTIVNNYTVTKGTVVNRGIPVERVAAATGAPVRNVALRDAPAGPTATVRSPGEIVAYRRPLKSPATPVNIVAQKIDAQHPVIRHKYAAPMESQRRIAPAPVRSEPSAGEVPRRPQTEVPDTTPRPAGEKSSF